ncbi:MAG: peptide chain release factor 2 [Planctomycetes bacterium]|nr:peptide chain release factor 2 [Planctomycetota bacterium]
MGETLRRAQDLKARLMTLRDSLDLAKKKSEFDKLEKDMGAPDFWNNAEGAQKKVLQLKALKGVIDPCDSLMKAAEDAAELAELAEGEGDASTLKQVATDLAKAESGLGALELRTLFADENDTRDCFVAIQAGTGGTDACDWARMILRMYQAYCERMGFEVKLIDVQEADEAGIRSATLEVRGPYSYGYMKGEHGVHRLVRVSPFDANHRRQTAFASVDVTPEFDEVDITINEADLKIDTYRSGGAGGQHVNVTDSAVRLTHIPTGIVVACQNERSQPLNKKMALKYLAAKLLASREAERLEKVDAARGAKGRIGFGSSSQIRSYTLNPFQLVKDARTDLESGNIQAVLDGRLEEFVEAYLRWNAKK